MPTHWRWVCFPIGWTKIYRMVANKPPVSAVYAVLFLAAASMAAAVYFGGSGQLPLALTGTALFVILGGVGFELARRRS